MTFDFFFNLFKHLEAILGPLVILWGQWDSNIVVLLLVGDTLPHDPRIIIDQGDPAEILDPFNGARENVSLLAWWGKWSRLKPELE
jgi:hypothetical protein